ncbi:MAG: potassium transporter TrkH [Alphaproteobacteria bacterium]|nr:potassium transporter TrkH [Alphaproteobacteria bacterium]
MHQARALTERDAVLHGVLGITALLGLLLAWPTRPDLLLREAWPWAAGAGASLLGLVAPLLLARGGRAPARGVATTGLLLLAALATLQRPDAPAFGLLALLGTGVVLVRTWDLLAPRRWSDETEPTAPRTSAAALTLLPGVLVVLASGLSGPPVRAALLAGALVVGVVVGSEVRSGHARPLAVPVTALALALVAGLTVLGRGGPAVALVPLAALAAVRRETRDEDAGNTLLDLILASPARLLVTSFAAICAVGTLLLSLPGSTTGAGAASLVDAAFTAVSATCVTGLAVLDTPTDLSAGGQVVVLLLIQVGALGIMTFAAAAVVWAGARLSVAQEAVAAQVLGGEARRDLRGALRLVLLVTFASEAVGALLLTPCFVAHGDGWGEAAWRAVFTSISAFCNAGFALQSDSLVPYAADPLVLGIVGLLILVGGLGPVVLVGLATLARGGRATVHVRLVLVATALLLVVPTVLIAVLEWSATLDGAPWGVRLANAAFQAITLRTAGFNSIDLAAVHPATWTVMVLCMYVGGSPGSTAGGVKTTTVAVLLLAVVTSVRRREEVVAFGRRIPTRVVYEATAITTIGVLCAVVALVALQLTQALPLEVALFEVVSALGTVGLTVGGTAQLDDVGKVIVMACMFAGRVGPLTLFVLLDGQGSGRAPRHPFEAVPVG